MGPKKVKVKMRGKIVRTTIQVKKDILQKYENRIRVSNLALQYGLDNLLICLLKNKESIKKLKLPKQ